MKDSYDALKTEGRNPRTLNIDRMSTVDMVKTVNAEYRAVEDAVDLVAEDIAAAVDLISDALSAGHHLIYVGAGTSGRLGVVDASECPPTFGVDPSLVRGVIAGGRDAMFRSSEGTEDSPEEGEAAISAEGIEPGDAIIGLHKWETLSMENVMYVLTRDDLASFSPLKFLVIRNRNVLYGSMTLTKSNNNNNVASY